MLNFKTNNWRRIHILLSWLWGRRELPIWCTCICVHGPRVQQRCHTILWAFYPSTRTICFEKRFKKNEFIWVHSLTKKKFSKMCRLQMCLICIFKVAAIGTVSNVKIRHNLTNHHIKTNNGSTLRFSGTGNSFVPLLLWFKVKITQWVKVTGHFKLYKSIAP